MYRFYSVSEALSSACSTATASDSTDYPFCFRPKRRPASVHQGLFSTSSTTDSPMLASSPHPPVLQLHVPERSTQNGHHNEGMNGLTAPSPIFGVGVGILLGQPPPANGNGTLLGNNGIGIGNGHRRSIFMRQKSEEAERKRRLTMPLIYRMYESQSDELCGTVRGPDDEDFRPEEASKRLREALAGGIQSHDQTLIDVMLAHNNFQRQKIANTYESSYGRVLSDDIDEEAGGHFAESILALLTPAHIYTARTLYFAISGKSFGRCVAIEIGLTSTASQLKVIRDTYQTEFRVSLERDLNMKVEGLFGKMLSQLLLRNEDFTMGQEDEEAARREADALFAEGSVEELGRSLDLFNRIFGLRSIPHIRAFVHRYDHRAQEEGLKEGAVGRESRGKSRERVRDFESAVRRSVNIHSDVKQAILLYVRISKNMQLYFAERLHEAISQNRPDNSSIIRILVSRSEIDLYDITNEYKRRYGHHLVYDLQNCCSGDFFRLLSQLVNPGDLASGDDAFA